MKNNIFTCIGFFIGILIWLLESIVHHFIFNDPSFEVIPHDINEIWMRSCIFFLFVSFGVSADLFTRKLVEKEKQLEAVTIYKSMIHAVHHILNNLLNQMQIFKMEAENCKDFNTNIIMYFDLVRDEAEDLVKKLSSVEELTGDNIKASVYPEK